MIVVSCVNMPILSIPSVQELHLRIEVCETRLIGSLSNYDGDGNENVTKQQVLISKTMRCTCVLNFGTFLCRSLQNNNVK